MIHSWLELIPMTMSDAHSFNTHWLRVCSGPGPVGCWPCPYSCFPDVGVIGWVDRKGSTSFRVCSNLLSCLPQRRRASGNYWHVGDLRREDMRAGMAGDLNRVAEQLSFLCAWKPWHEDLAAVPWAQTGMTGDSALQGRYELMKPADSFWICSLWGNLYYVTLRDFGEPCGSFVEIFTTDIYIELNVRCLCKKKDELVDFKFCKLLRLDFLQMGQVRLCCVVCVSCTGFLLVQLQPQALGVSWVICTLEIKLWSNIYHALSAFRCPFLFHLIPTATFWSRYYTSDILLRIREVSFQKQDLNPILWNSEVQAVVVTKCNCAHRTPDTWMRGRLTYSLHLPQRRHCSRA